MAMVLSCSCGKQLRVREAKAGKRGHCPSCGRRFRLPSAEFVSAHDGKEVSAEGLAEAEAAFASAQRQAQRAPAGETKQDAGPAEMRVRCHCHHEWALASPAESRERL